MIGFRNGDCLLRPAQTFAKVAPHEPEPPEGACQTKRLLSHRLVQDPAERCPQVITLGLQAVEPLTLMGPEQVRLSLLRQGDVVARVSSLNVRKIILRQRESVAGKLSERLEEPVADHSVRPFLREHQ